MMRKNHVKFIQKLITAHNMLFLGAMPAVSFSDQEKKYYQWLQKGLHGSMDYLERQKTAKYNPNAILDNCRTIIFVGLNYYQQRSPDSFDRSHPSGPEQGKFQSQTTSGRISRYAWGRDYHKTLGKMLKTVTEALQKQFPNEKFRFFTDSGPLDERFFAAYSGAGYIGRNHMLITPHFGSWVFLGEILTTVNLSSYVPVQKELESQIGCPLGCKRCIEACPTHALSEDGTFDASRCISYLTIENRGDIDIWLRYLMGDWLFGCDICQEVCPVNNTLQKPTNEKDFLERKVEETISLQRILQLRDSAEFTSLFAGTPVMRAKLTGIQRNACIIAVNKKATHLLPELRALSCQGDGMVREYAIWAISELGLY